MSQPFKLYRLQLLDSKLDQARARLKEIEIAIHNDSELRQAQVRAETSRENTNNAIKALQRAEENVKAQQLKIEQTEATLYSGKVRNPKELQDLQNESAALKRYLAVLEDRQLEAMISLEEIEATDKEASARFEQVQADFSHQNEVLTREKSQLLQEVEQMEIERRATINSIPTNDLELYSNLRRSRRGVAVSKINDKSCSACGTILSSGLLHASRSPDQITRCDTCGRILYFG